MPSVYIPLTPFGSGDQSRLERRSALGAKASWRLPAESAGFREDGPDGLDDLFRGDQPEASMVPLGADALVAVLAGDVVVEHAMGDSPGRVLGVGQRVE